MLGMSDPPRRAARAVFPTPLFPARNVLSGLTEEEKHMCIQVFDRICNNAEEHLREYKKKTNENESLDMKSTGNHLFYSQLMEKEQDQKDGREQLQTTDSGCDGSNI